jgi:predicted secreted hydrolase
MKPKRHLFTIIILIFYLILNGSLCQIIIVNGKNNEEPAQNSPKPPSTYLLPNRQVLKPNDEGSHQSKKNFIMTQEWWYYNAFFNEPDSELRNWSLMISFNQMGIADIFFMTLYDDENKSYGGSSPKISGTIQSGGPGVKINYYTSYVIGIYPKWHIYAMDYDLDENNIIVNITYKANSLPLWLLFNSGHNISRSPAGHYCIMNCEVTGELIINEAVYKVHGIGYHEHSWFKFFTKQNKQVHIQNIGQTQANFQDIIDVWDWFCIHFDNGWDMFAGKFFQKSSFARFMPGSLWITPDGKNITECFFFKMEYLDTIESSIPSIKIPTKIHIYAIFLNTLITNPLKGLIRLDVVIDTKNIYEHLWGDPPQYGVWEGPCSINGSINWQGNTVELNGWSIMELTRSVT